MVSNFEHKLRRQTNELHRMYGGHLVKITDRVNELIAIVEKNRISSNELAHTSKVNFALFDMMKRNFAGKNPAIRPVLDVLWGNAMQLNSDVTLC